MTIWYEVRGDGPGTPVAFAVELGDEKAIAANLHEYMTMLFYTAEVRDAFIARSASFSYHQTPLG